MVSIHQAAILSAALGIAGAAGHPPAAWDPGPSAPAQSVVLGWAFRPTSPATMQWVFQTRSGRTVILTAPFPQRALSPQDARSAWTSEDAVSPLRALMRKDPAELRRLWPATVEPSADIRVLLTVAHLNPKAWGGPAVVPLQHLQPANRLWLAQMGFSAWAQHWHPAVSTTSRPSWPHVPAEGLGFGLIVVGGLGIWGWRRAHPPPPML